MTNPYKYLVLGIVLLIACNSDSNKEKTSTAAPAATAIMPVDSVKTFDQSLVDNKKDPSCGMPVTAGIFDTAHFKNKVLGFCSTECKQSFMKDADKNFAMVEFKK